jgi:hypothetical protein
VRRAEAGFPRYYNRATVLTRQNQHLDALQELHNFLQRLKDWDPRTQLVDVSNALTGTGAAPGLIPGLLQPTIAMHPTPPEATVTSGAFEAEQQQLSQLMEVDQSAVSDSTEVVVEIENTTEQSAVHDSADNDNITNTVTDSVNDEIAVSHSDTVDKTSSQAHDTEEEELDRQRQIYLDEGMATAAPKRLPKTERKALAKSAKKEKDESAAEDKTSHDRTPR